MPSPADRDLAGRDPALPGLGLVLDAAAVQCLLAQQFADRVSQLTLEKHYIDYQPGAHCLVAYVGRADGQVFECFAKTHGAAAAPAKLDHAMRQPALPGPFGPGRLALEPAAVVVSFFPNDGKLRGLGKLADRNLWPALFGAASVNPDSARLTPLDYQPEHHFVGRLDQDQQPKLVVKLYRPDCFAEARRRAEFAATLPFLPQLRAVNEATHALVFDWQPGRALIEDIRGRTAHPADLREAGRRIAALHAIPPARGLGMQSVESEHAALQPVLNRLRRLVPEAHALIDRLEDLIGEILFAMPSRATLVHGDFHPNRVLLQAHGARLLDCDQLRIGDPAADLGLFVAHLECEVLFGRLDSAAADSLQRAFCEGYREAGAQYSEQALQLYTTLGLLSLAHRPFRDCYPNWSQRTQDWLNRCEALLLPVTRLGQRRGQAAAGSDPATPGGTNAIDPALPFLARALDPARVQTILAESLCQHFPAELLHSCTAQLVRHQPGRRASIEYRFRDVQGNPSATLLGKVCAKHLDSPSYRLTRALHALGPRQLTHFRLELPQPYSAVPELHMWVQQRIAGQPAWELLSGDGGERLAEAIAEALHALHSSGIQPERTHTIEDEYAMLDARLADACVLRPIWTHRIRQIARASENLAKALGRRPLVPVHRNFDPDRILVSDQQLYLLDLDRCRLGDAAVDVGNFVAQLQEQDLRYHRDPWFSLPVQRAFTERYFGLSDDPDLPMATDVYRIMALARHIHISAQCTERQSITNRLLALCEEQLLKCDFPAEPDAHCG